MRIGDEVLEKVGERRHRIVAGVVMQLVGELRVPRQDRVPQAHSLQLCRMIDPPRIVLQRDGCGQHLPRSPASPIEMGYGAVPAGNVEKPAKLVLADVEAIKMMRHLVVELLMHVHVGMISRMDAGHVSSRPPKHGCLSFVWSVAQA